MPSLTCNGNCSCDPMSFTPVCGSDGQNYFSPCYAGCQIESSIENTTVIYTALLIYLFAQLSDWWTQVRRGVISNSVLRYDTIEEYNVDSKAECDQLNLARRSYNAERLNAFDDELVNNTTHRISIISLYYSITTRDMRSDCYTTDTDWWSIWYILGYVQWCGGASWACHIDKHSLSYWKYDRAFDINKELGYRWGTARRRSAHYTGLLEDK